MTDTTQPPVYPEPCVCMVSIDGQDDCSLHRYGPRLIPLSIDALVRHMRTIEARAAAAEEREQALRQAAEAAVAFFSVASWTPRGYLTAAAKVRQDLMHALSQREETL